MNEKIAVLIDKDHIAKCIIEKYNEISLSKVLFQGKRITYDQYVFNKYGINLYLLDDDHIINDAPNFYYKNGELKENVNHVTGRAVIIAELENKNNLVNFISECLQIKENENCGGIFYETFK